MIGNSVDDRYRYELRDFGRAWLRMAPPLLVSWLVAAAPPGPGVREVFVAAILSVFVVVAAAKARGIHEGRSLIRVGFERLVSHAIDVLMFLLILFLAAGLGGTVGNMAAGAIGVPEPVVAVPATVLATLPILYWFWPVLVLAGAAPAETGRPGRSVAVWRGPGYTSARRLLASFGSTGRTALVLGVGYLWLGLLVAVEQYRGGSGFPLAVEAASYGLLYPFWTWLAVVETQRLVRAVLDGRAAAGTEE
ncbi:MAG: hypothetical protein ACOCUW_03850 [Gemmatimonadota bacterium]